MAKKNNPINKQKRNKLNYQKNKEKILQNQKILYAFKKKKINKTPLNRSAINRRYYKHRSINKIKYKYKKKIHKTYNEFYKKQIHNYSNLLCANKIIIKYRIFRYINKIQMTEMNKTKHLKSAENKKQYEKRKIQNTTHNMKKLINDYDKSIRDGPTNTCICCGGLWFSSQIKYINMDNITKKYSKEFTQKVFYINHTPELKSNIVCKTCDKYIENGQVPKLSLWNGLEIPDTPESLKYLTCLEERLCAPRIPFMQIKKLGFERQCGLKGQIVNVPININTTVEALPRSIQETYTIQLHIKRKMNYNNDYMCEIFRPNAVFKACDYLKTTELYKLYKINIKTDTNIYNCTDNTDYQMFVVDKEDIKEAHKMTNNTNNKYEYYNTDNANYACEETLLNNTTSESITLAPGENQIPISLLFDAHVEELSFPTIFCGIIRKYKINLTYNQIVKSLIRNYKRKCARVDFLFFMYKKLELIKLSSHISICLRKKYLQNNILTVHEILNEKFLDKLIQHDDGYKLLESFPSAPAYWQKEGKELRAMIRQLGIPTFFITLSSAETKWIQLLIILEKITNNRDLTFEEAEQLTFTQRSKLIRNDPVTCARYFDHRIREIMKIIKNKNGIFKNNPCLNFYWRIEVQQRGSLHIHGLFWLQNVPVIFIY